MTSVDIGIRSSPDVAQGRATTMCAVIVVNYGSHTLLAANLARLSDGCSSLKVVVVDNFTSHEERLAIRELADQHGWTLLLEDANIGFGAGVNRGAEWAIAHGATQLLLLNPDATISRDDLATLQEYVARHPKTVVAPVVRTPEGKVWFAGAAVSRATGEVRSTPYGSRCETDDLPWLSGACLLIDAKMWTAIGGFDERYFLYWEDVDLSYRVLDAGGELKVLFDTVAVHDQGGTQQASSARAKSETYYYHMVRNRLFFAYTHLRTREQIRWSVNAPKYAWRVLLHGGRRQLLHSLSPVRAIGSGLLAGLGSARRGRRSLSRVSQPLVVLQSVPGPRATTNPYNVLLAEGLASHPDVDLRMFSWIEALFHRHDIFHAHWPEAMIARRGTFSTAVRRTLFLTLLMKWAVDGTAIVRTVHNLEMPSGLGRMDRVLLSRFDRMTVGRITLNPFTPVSRAEGHPVQMIMHGHYHPWFAQYELPEVERGRVATFGMIRRYKGMEHLVRAFRSLDRLDLSLSIAGKPSTAALADDLRAAAENDPRIHFTFDFLDTADLVDHVGRSELVVLPHTDMHNSGSALAALSLDRPILMQDNEVNRWLQAEVGRAWVHLYRGALTGSAIAAAVDEFRAHLPQHLPDLSARGWPAAVERHVELYRTTVRARSSGEPRGHHL